MRPLKGSGQGYIKQALGFLHVYSTTLVQQTHTMERIVRFVVAMATVVTLAAAASSFKKPEYLESCPRNDNACLKKLLQVLIPKLSKVAHAVGRNKHGCTQFDEYFALSTLNDQQFGLGWKGMLVKAAVSVSENVSITVGPHGLKYNGLCRFMEPILANLILPFVLHLQPHFVVSMGDNIRGNVSVINSDTYALSKIRINDVRERQGAPRGWVTLRPSVKLLNNAVGCLHHWPLSVHCLHHLPLSVHCLHHLPLYVHCLHHLTLSVHCLHHLMLSVHCLHHLTLSVHCLHHLMLSVHRHLNPTTKQCIDI
uniref:Uncharacterized protein n=1 Tax=Timema tahoe TaxID=61484 RepID=A0A7R9IDY7_9NEOP|nr:unnamed protein product [Timema tahoe]